jgi:hypothetical protein
VLVRIAFAGGELTVWTPGTGTISWDGSTWTGLYPILQISGITETSTASPSEMTISLAPIVYDRAAGLVKNLITTIRDTPVRGTEVEVYQGFLDDAGAIVPDPLLRSFGRISQRMVTGSPDGWSIGFRVVKWLEDGDRATQFAQTKGRMASLGYPGDKFFDFAPENLRVNWPGAGYWRDQKG